MTSDPSRPNILLVLVDELRYPMHFPEGIDDAGAFVRRFMPNVHRHLWKDGVRFSRYYAAAADCSAARGTLVTGLYAQQTNLMIVRDLVRPAEGGRPAEPPLQPPLQPEFPTYGKLLREHGYDTPYIGKWHLSDAPDPAVPGGYMHDYGFDGLTMPDVDGVAGQGIGAAPGLVGDPGVADQAIDWLARRASGSLGDAPFCLTVGFINPHDKQWFWSGSEGKRFQDVYEAAHATQFAGALEALVAKTRPPGVDIAGEADPPRYGYSLPPNWESKASLDRPDAPSLAAVQAALLDFTCGGARDEPGSGFATRPSPLDPAWTSAMAPHEYWTRALDMYTKVIQDVDAQVGRVLDAIPAALRENMVVVFTSDHGEYASSHGLQGKGGPAYEETMLVPLVVRDYTGRFARAPEVERTQVASQVDVLRLLVSIAHGGDAWLTGEYEQMYGSRLDLLGILREPATPGRPFAAYTYDEYFLPWAINYKHAPQHAAAMMFPNGKLTAYAHWIAGTNDPIPSEHFYYDRSTRAGLLELESSPSPIGLAEAALLFATEVRAPLPERYRAAQARALEQYWAYAAIVEASAAAAIVLTKMPAPLAAALPAASVPRLLPRANSSSG